MTFRVLLLASLCCVAQNLQAQKMPFPQYNGERFALIDAQTLKPITPYKYESLANFLEGLSLATSRSEAGKLQYCFLNAQGKEAIAPTTNRLYAFSEGKARMKVGDRFGYIDAQGKNILPASYVSARDYKEGRTMVVDADLRLMILDEKGGLLERFDSEINYFHDYHDGLALIGTRDGEEPEYTDMYTRTTGNYAFYNKQGKRAIDLKKINEKINYASDFKNGAAIVGFVNPTYDPQNPTVYGAINTKGELIVPMTYNSVEHDHSGNLKIQKYDNNTYISSYGLMDNKGKELMPCEYTFIFEAVGNYRIFQKRIEQTQSNGEYEPYPDRYGIASTDGKILVAPTHKDLYLSKNGDYLTLDSTTVGSPSPDEGNVKNSAFYSHHHISGKTYQLLKEMDVYSYYVDANESDSERQGMEYRTGDVPMVFAGKTTLLNQERHELMMPFYDEIAPFTQFSKGEKIAVREGKKWQYLDEHLNPLPAIYEGATNFSDSYYAPVKKNSKWGLINKTGTEITGFVYDSIVPSVSRVKYKEAISPSLEGMGGGYYVYEALRTTFLPAGYFIAKQNGQWGIINFDGKVVLPFQYEKIKDAFYNYVVIGKDNRWGIVDYAGKAIVPAQYTDIRVINDLAYVHNGSKEGLMDLQGNTIVAAEYDSIFEPNQNFIKVLKNKKIGYLTYQGKEALPAVYDEVHLYSDRQAYITIVKDKKWGVLNQDFKPIVACEYDSLTAEEWRKYIWVKKGGLAGLLDMEGKTVIAPKYQYIDNLDRDNYSPNPRFLLAKLNNKWGLLDTIGKVIVPFEYDLMQVEYSRERVVIGKKNKVGLMRPDGKIVIPIKYDELGQFQYQNHLIGFKKKGKWGFINSAGKEVIPATFDDANAFAQVANERSQNVYFAIVKKGKYYGIINDTGKTVIPFSFERIDYIPYNTLQPISVTRNGVQEQIDFKGQPYKGE